MVSILYFKTKYVGHLGQRIYIYIEFQCTQLISLTTVSSVSFITVNGRSFRTVFSCSVRLQCDCYVITTDVLECKTDLRLLLFIPWQTRDTKSFSFAAPL